MSGLGQKKKEMLRAGLGDLVARERTCNAFKRAGNQKAHTTVGDLRPKTVPV